MIGRKQEIFSQLNQVVDALLLGLALWFAYLIRAQDYVSLDIITEIPPFSSLLWILAVIMPFGPLLLEMQGFYNQPLRKNVGRSLTQILGAGAWLALLLGLCVIFLHVALPSRSILIFFGCIAPALLLLRERMAAQFYFRGIRKGEIRENILLAGEPEAMKEFWQRLPRLLRLELNVVQRISLATSDLENLTQALHQHSVGRVLLCFHRMEMDTVQKAISACEVEGVEAWLSADFIRTSIARPTYESLSGHPMLVFRATPEISWALLMKSALDRIGSVVLLVLLSPLLLFTAILIKGTSPGPIFFRQSRCGLHGKKFIIYKFRSMVSGAEDLRESLTDKNEMSGPVFKLSLDPRVTGLGSFLRKTSIDELPQLFNVLRGEMSLVGPRPLPDYEVAKFDKLSYRRRLSMKPGLTCLWQIRGRNKVTSFDEWVRMDLEYIDNWSFGLDIVILIRTIPAVLFGQGAR